MILSDGFFVSTPSWCVRSGRKHASMNPEAKLSVRCRPGNPNHHLWNNNGTFWCHLTVHLSNYTKTRLRLSLETGDIRHARQLRDSLFALFGVAPL